MSLRPYCLLLTALACLAQPSHADDAPQPRRTTISLLAGGKEVAGLVLLPGQGQHSFTFNALRQEEAPDGSLHASGRVQLSLRMGDAPSLTIYGDDLIVRSAVLDPDQAQALDDLKRMGASDQSVRGDPANLTKNDWARQEAIDKANMARLAAIVARYGWPGMRFAGAEYASNALLVLQHADAATQHRYLPLVRAAAARGEVPAADLALLEDRVLKSDGKPQLYGTQFVSTKPLKLYAVADEAQLDQRRREMGLPPMSEYLQLMRQIYQSD
jgi:hypothetical protein